MKEMNKKNAWLLVRIAVSAGLILLLAKTFDLSSVPSLFRSVRPLYIAVALFLILLSVAISARKWFVLVRAQNLSVGYGELFASYLTGLFFNNFLPSSIGGDAARVLAVGKSRGLIPELTASVVAERMLATASLALVGLTGAAFSRFRNPLALILLASVFIFALLANAVLVSGWLPGSIRRGVGKFSRAARNAADSASLLRKRPIALVRSFAGAALFQVIVALVMQASLFALGVESVPFPDIVFAASASSVLAMIPAGINGYGLREGSYALLLAPYGVAAGVAVSASLLFSFLVTLFSVFGLFAWLINARKNISPIKEKQYA